MGQLRTVHLIEAGLWLLLIAFLYGFSFKFNQSIEIYKFGASAWPRGLLFLAVLAVLGQLFWQYRFGDASAHPERDAPEDTTEVHEGADTGFMWYLHCAFLIALPFVYLRLPDLFYYALSLQPDTAHWVKLLVGAVVVAVFILSVRGNHVGAMLALPLLFAAMLEDFGFYSLAPFFMLAVMYLMGERRIRAMVAVMALLFGVLLVLFVSLLFVGLPVGNVEPFYSIGNWVVSVLQ